MAMADKFVDPVVAEIHATRTAMLEAVGGDVLAGGYITRAARVIGAVLAARLRRFTRGGFYVH